MRILRFIVFCCLIISLGRVVPVAKGDTVVESELVEALGKTKKTKNNKGGVTYDFTRLKRELRLEDIILNFAPLNEGCSIEGAFTLSHPGEVDTEPTERIFVSCSAANGKLELVLKKDEGKNPLKLILTSAAVAVSPSRADAKIATTFSAKLKDYCTGDAGRAMENALHALSKRLINLSQMKQPKVEKSDHTGWS